MAAYRSGAGAAPQGGSKAGAASASSSPGAASASRPAAAAAPAERPGRTGAIAGFVAGLLVTGGAVAALLATDFLAPAERTRALQERLTALDAQVRDLAGRPPATDARLEPLAARIAAGEQAQAQVKDLEARLARAEAALKERPGTAPDPAVGERLAAADAAAKQTTDAMAALRKRVDEVAAAQQATRETAAQASGAAVSGFAGEIGDVLKRVANLEAALESLRAATAKPQPDIDRAARLAAAASALRTVVERGEPFASELAVVKTLVPDEASLSALQGFASTGVPHAGALSRELSTLAVTLRRAPDRDTSTGMLERLQASAEKLVRIRPVDEPAVPAAAAGDGLVRVETFAVRNDIAGALSALAAMPPAERAPFDAWISKARSRVAAIEQVQTLARTALDGLAATR